MPHRDSVTTEDMVDLSRDLFGKPKVSVDYKALNKAEQERTKQLREQIAAWKLKHAKQFKFEFAEPGEDWGSL